MAEAEGRSGQGGRLCLRGWRAASGVRGCERCKARDALCGRGSGTHQRLQRALLRVGARERAAVGGDWHVGFLERQTFPRCSVAKTSAKGGQWAIVRRSFCFLEYSYCVKYLTPLWPPLNFFLPAFVTRLLTPRSRKSGYGLLLGCRSGLDGGHEKKKL